MKERLDKVFNMDYNENMGLKIAKIRHVRGQTIVSIPKALAIEGGLDKLEYAEVWLTDRRTIHIRGLKVNGGEKRDI